MKRALLLVVALAGASPALAGDRPIDWDLYHERQDACREKDRIAAQCSQGYCDELALRQATRACSAFGPLGERRGEAWH